MENLIPTSGTLWISVVVFSIACGAAHSESDGLVPAVVVRGEDSPNASAIVINPAGAKANAKLPGLRKPAPAASVSKLRAKKRELPKPKSSGVLPGLSSLRASEFEFAPHATSTEEARTAAAGPNYLESVDGSRFSTAGFDHAIAAAAAGSDASRGESKVQQTQFLKTNIGANQKLGANQKPLDRTKRLESPLSGPNGSTSSRAVEITSGPAGSFVPMAVSVGDPSIATPEAYMAAPANDPVAAATSPTGHGKSEFAARTRFASPATVPARRMPAPVSTNPFQLQGEVRSPFAVSSPKKPVVARPSVVTRPSGLQPATLATGKKPARTSFVPKISIPKIGLKKPSWLPDSLRR